VDRSYFLDAHFEGAPFLKDYDVVYTTVQHKLVEEVRKNHPGVRMVDADEGGAERAKRRGLEHPSLIKIRTNDSDKNRIIVPPEVRRYIMGREVGILEDMSGSGGTLMDSIDALYDHGAQDVFCAYTHSQLPGGYMRVKEHLSKKFPEKEPYDRIYTTNSIGTQDRFVVNVTDTIVETLKKAA
jgi:phosphoribosylpyrophosphate synthetase